MQAAERSEKPSAVIWTDRPGIRGTVLPEMRQGLTVCKAGGKESYMQIEDRKQGETGRDYALRTLRSNIVFMDLKPGAMISEKEIADCLGLSRTPVREAMIELSRMGILEVLPQKGCRVSLIDYGMVEEACFIRSVLENAVAELACSMASLEDIRRLEENILLQEFYLSHFDHKKILELDNGFHKMLFEITGKEQCHSLISGMNIHFDRVRDISILSVKDIKIVEDHKSILKAVKEKNAAAVRAAMEKHLGRFRVDEQVIRQKYPEYMKDTVSKEATEQDN